MHGSVLKNERPLSCCLIFKPGTRAKRTCQFFRKNCTLLVTARCGVNNFWRLREKQEPDATVLRKFRSNSIHGNALNINEQSLELAVVTLRAAVQSDVPDELHWTQVGMQKWYPGSDGAACCRGYCRTHSSTMSEAEVAGSRSRRDSGAHSTSHHSHTASIVPSSS